VVAEFDGFESTKVGIKFTDKSHLPNRLLRDSHLVAEWTNESGLAYQVAASLMAQIRDSLAGDKPPAGWVRGTPGGPNGNAQIPESDDTGWTI
jgi:hypothetical protein